MQPLHKARPSARTRAYMLTVYVHSEASTGCGLTLTRARVQRRRQPLNRETSSSVPVPMATSESTSAVQLCSRLKKKGNHLLKTYSHVEKLRVDGGWGGAGGCRRSGPWPTFSFQAWNSHILPHCGRRWGGMMPWLLTLLYAQNSPSRAAGKQHSSPPFIIPNTFHRFSLMHYSLHIKTYSSIAHAATSEIFCTALK